nr:PQQ-dependent sugar dehydrogenase [Nitrosopumilus sp.]
IIGDKKHETKVQNIKNGDDPDFTGSIFRINPLNGSALLDNPFIGLDVPNMEKTYSYGIRNSFGLASDPITGTIWDTENGPSFSDEINIVYPGFNSGWLEVMGPISSSGGDDKNIVEFANSKYYDPLVTWPSPVAVTDIEFIDTLQLGLEYRNNILVGDHNNGNLYFFRVNEDRTGINLNDPILDSENEMESSILGSGFGSISDIETGSDGNMYIVSLGTGTVYTIS